MTALPATYGYDQGEPYQTGRRTARQPAPDFGSVVWESSRSVHAKCMDCRWIRNGTQTSDPAKRHARTTGHSIMMSVMTTSLVVPERGIG